MSASPLVIRPESKIDLMLNFGTSQVRTFNGKEQIQAFQIYPRINIKHTHVLHSSEAEKLLSTLSMNIEFLLPLWWQELAYWTSIPSGTSLLLFDTTRREFAIDEYILIKDSSGSCVRKIVGLTTGQIQLDSVTPVAFTRPSLIPMRTAYLATDPKYSEYAEHGLINITLDFVLRDRLILSSKYDAVNPIFRDLMVFLFPNYFSSNTLDGVESKNISIIDHNSGFVRAFSGWQTPHPVRSWGFFGNDYMRNRRILELSYYLKGNQQLFYAPTYRNEFKITRDHLTGESYIAVEKRDFGAMNDKLIHSRGILFSAPNGSFLREIDHITADSLREYIHLTEPLAYDLPYRSCHICWLILSRADSPYVQIAYEGVINAECMINTIEVWNG